MAMTLRHLCKYAKENYDMKLICGEKNMNNIVKWVHMLEDPETATFLKGQELIFSTGIGHDNTDWFIEFVRGLVENQASGLVLNIGPHIKEVPKELKAYCEALQFPLFTIPWQTKIVDITYDFCHNIMQAEKSELTVAEAFRNIIFFPDKISEYRPIIERKSYDVNASYRIVALSLQGMSKDNYLDYEKKVDLHLKRILYNYSDRFSVFRQDQYFIVILQNFSKENISKGLYRLEELCKDEKGYTICSGISRSDFGILSLSRNYKRAISVLKIAQKQVQNQLFYDDIGLYQLLIEVEDMKVLKKFYEDTLGQLEDYDKKNQTDYLETLKLYLDNNNSVEKVAKITFVHRNTINYKIKKIKEIIDCELNYQDGLKIYMAFHMKDFL
ncbi:DNA-binding PucR family transcriptional regulator [Natranaerovirga hydrolytica]|uniref:DNA-binding PucR family transcriptional regulator n=1 Tax=Natranaerovirga hydrolytica TaxID=680378 RepID=A0A4R1MKX3_9FIRM|nr:PucR family transcriptional regulator [Natranaerovirga hydrolytica]TCK93217.1 DNA-binding PucR family transcriptional regulator [Natranaerovirga hydrolytica]